MGTVDPSARYKEMLALAEDILADLELDRRPLTSIVMKCARLARLIGDEEAQQWFRFEMGGYDFKEYPESFEIAWGAVRSVPETRDKPADSGERRAWTGSIPAMEAAVATLREELAHLDVPAITEGSTRNEYYIPGSTTRQIVDTFLARQRDVSLQITEQASVLAGIRQAIHEWALNRYYLLRFVDIPSDAFQRAKVLVDERLAEIAPDALRMFVAAQERALSGVPEEGAQAMASLRRMMKAAADALYPATDRTVDGHVLDDSHYVNRLWQFVRERTESDRRAVLTGQVEYIGHRIETLNDLASKGVHDVVTQQEVDLCVVHLYLLFADLLSMAEPGAAAAPPAASPAPEGSEQTNDRSQQARPRSKPRRAVP